MRLIKQTPLWLLTAISFAAYCLFPYWFPLWEHFGQVPPADVRSLQPSPVVALVYALVLTGLFLIYGRAVQLLQRRDSNRGLATVVLIGLLLSVPLVLTYPINANDVFRYVIRGRLSSVYEANPYRIAPADIADDPLLPLAGEWAEATSPYGPLWELAAAGTTRATGGDLLSSQLAFKVMAVAAHLLVAGLIWAIVSAKHRRPAQDQRLAVSLAAVWAWNPALLLIFTVDAHNEALMILWLVLGYFLISRDRPVWGLIMVTVAALTKPVAILAWPVLALALLRQLPAWNERLRLLLPAAAGSLIVALAAFAPYGSPWELAARLVSEGSAGASFSWATLLLLVAQRAGMVLSIGGTASVALLLFGLFSLFILWRVWRGRSSLAATADILGGYLILAMNFRIWYAAWPFPWLILDRAPAESSAMSDYRMRAGIWFLLTSQLSVLIYGHLRVWLLGGDVLLAHLIGVPFTFLLPFFLARLNVFTLNRNVLP